MHQSTIGSGTNRRPIALTDSTDSRARPDTISEAALETNIPPRPLGWRLLRRLLIYHTALAAVLLIIAWSAPSWMAELPIGGVGILEDTADVSVTTPVELTPQGGGSEIVSSLIQATSQFDRLGDARKLVLVLIGTWVLMLPVSWVIKGIHESSIHDHSLDETTLVLPGVVAAIVLVVQHSLALAFSLAGIIAGVHFRRALQDTFDALFILVAIGVGIAGGVEALEIAAVLTVFFAYATLYVTFFGDGLESHHSARQKALKKLRKQDAPQGASGDDIAK